MDVHFEDFRANQHTVEVGADDTAEDMRRKVASAMRLPEDSFCMSFGVQALGEGYDMTQLSAGDTIMLTKSLKYEAVAELHALGETDLTEERLEEVKDPKVACLFLQAEVVDFIPDDFFSGTLLRRLDLSAESIVTDIGKKFLADCTSLTSIDLSGLSNVTYISLGFLSGCEALTTIDLVPLVNLSQVGESFLSNCSKLTNLDLSPLRNVSHIESGFLCGCESLPTIDLSPLSNVTQVGAYFLSDCTSLTTLDLSPLSNVTQIGRGFLINCDSLRNIDLSPLSNVTTIGVRRDSKATEFAARCTSLTSIYLSGCSSVVSNEVRKSKKLSQLVILKRLKRSRDESPEQARKLQRHKKRRGHA